MNRTNLIGFLVTIGALVYLFLQHIWGRMDGIDSHVFTSMGYHMLEGKTLYKDIWESKPANIYVLNAAAMKLFGVRYAALWFVQLVNAVIATSLIYALTFRWTRDRHFSWLASLFFIWLFYFSGMYYSGNCTEEFGVTALLAGIYGLFAGIENGKKWHFFLSGLSFSMAFWFKEPFLFSMLPWLVWYGIRQLRLRNIRSLGWTLAGLAGPFIVYGIAYALTGTLETIYKTFIYNRAYTEFLGISLAEKVKSSWHFYKVYFSYGSRIVPFLPLVLIPALVLSRNRPVRQRIMLLLTAQIGMDFMAISLSGLAVAHYYLQMIPAFVLLISYALWSMVSQLQFRYGLVAKGIMLGVLANLLFNVNLAPGPDMSKQQEVVNYLKNHKKEDDRLFVENAWYGHLYVSTQMVSDALIPNPIAQYFMIQDKYNHERVGAFVQSLRSSPPRFIVTCKERGMLKNHAELNQWFYGLYKEVQAFDIGTDTLKVFEISLP